MQVPYGSFQNTSRLYIAVGGNEQLTELMSIKDLVSHNLLHGYGFGEYVLFFQENLFLKERQIGVIVYRLYLVVLQLIPVYQAGDRFQFIFRMHLNIHETELSPAWGRFPAGISSAFIMIVAGSLIPCLSLKANSAFIIHSTQPVASS